MAIEPKPHLNRHIRRAVEKARASPLMRKPHSKVRNVYAPEVMSLAYGEPETLHFFKTIRDAFEGLPTGDAFNVDLVNTKELELGAALVLCAEFDRWQRIKLQRLVPYSLHTWDPGVINELDSLGFFKLLGTNLPPTLKRAKRKAWIQFISDTQTIGRAILLLRRRLELGLATLTSYDQQIYVALIEAMKNAFQHAYPDDLSPMISTVGVGKRWWMAAVVDAERKSLEVAFLDLGVMIPRSLPFSWMWSEFAAKDREGGDSALILNALMYGRSRLEEPHRGKGFSNILNPTQLNSSNVVSVHSGRGLCIDTGEAILAIERECPLAGTLIKWYFDLGR